MSAADQIRVAELTGAARYYARWRELAPSSPVPLLHDAHHSCPGLVVPITTNHGMLSRHRDPSS